MSPSLLELSIFPKHLLQLSRAACQQPLIPSTPAGKLILGRGKYFLCLTVWLWFGFFGFFFFPPIASLLASLFPKERHWRCLPGLKDSCEIYTNACDAFLLLLLLARSALVTLLWVCNDAIQMCVQTMGRQGCL